MAPVAEPVAGGAAGPHAGRGDDAVIRFVHATKRFPGGTVAVDDVSFDVVGGSVTGVIGYSGAGKSTLVRLINALEGADEGHVYVHGRDVTALSEADLRRVRADVGMIFQQFNLFSSRTVAGNVGYPLRLARVPKAERNARIEELLRFVGLADLSRRYPSQLSGGQKQRVGIARALATRPSILLADEATSALDPETTQDVLALLRQINERLGTTIVVITHEPEVVKSICDRVLVMENGHIIEQGDVYQVFANPRHEAAKGFVHSALRDLPDAETLERLRGRHPGRLVTVKVVENNGDGSSLGTIFDLLQNSPVRARVVHGGIQEVARRPFGSLTYEFVGSDADVADLLARLRERTEIIDHGRENA